MVTLSLELSTTGLITQRTLSSTFLLFIGTLLGSVFGMMGSFSSLMAGTEKVYDIAGKKHENSKKIRKLVRDSHKIKDCFKDEVYEKNKEKVKKSAFLSFVKVTPEGLNKENTTTTTIPF